MPFILVRHAQPTKLRVLLSNKRGYISFATSGADSRTTQMFINFGDNTNLDGMGFSPFGRVLGNGMDVVDKIYSGHGETPDQVQSPRAGPTWRPPCAPCDCPHCGLELTDARRGPSRAGSRARATSTSRRRSRDSHVHAAGRLPSVSMCPEMRSARLLVIHATQSCAAADINSVTIKETEWPRKAPPDKEL